MSVIRKIDYKKLLPLKKYYNIVKVPVCVYHFYSFFSLFVSQEAFFFFIKLVSFVAVLCYISIFYRSGREISTAEFLKDRKSNKIQ